MSDRTYNLSTFNVDKTLFFYFYNYSVVLKALYLGVLKSLKIEILTKNLKNDYFLALLE